MRRRAIARGGGTRRRRISRQRCIDSLERRVVSTRYTRTPVFSLFFTGGGKILSRLSLSACNAESARIVGVQAVQTMAPPLIAHFPPVHVNFAGTIPEVSPNRQDDADT